MVWLFGGGHRVVVVELNEYIGSMARPATLGMERHLRDFAHVDSDRRQDPPQSHTASESLVELYVIFNT